LIKDDLRGCFRQRVGMARQGKIPKRGVGQGRRFLNVMLLRGENFDKTDSNLIWKGLEIEKKGREKKTPKKEKKNQKAKRQNQTQQPTLNPNPKKNSPPTPTPRHQKNNNKKGTPQTKDKKRKIYYTAGERLPNRENLF